MNGNSNQVTHFHLLYAPPQDGDDASGAYTSRASNILQSASDIGELIPEGGPLWEGNDDDSSMTHCFVFIISCSADGSVNRSVRKVMRKLSSSEIKCSRRRYAMALLGHARCDNSAKQMVDTIFGSGRRFEKALAGSSYFAGSGALIPRLETQVELHGPEEQFDPWVKSLEGEDTMNS